MTARKLLALALVAGLIVGSLGVADAKKKKKKKKVKLVASTSTFFLRNTSECDLEALSLSLVDAEDSDCYDPLNAAGAAAGYVDHVYTASDGVPLILDATKKITGTITMRNGNSAGAGLGGVDLTFTGESGGTETTIATWEAAPAPIVPATVHTHQFEAEIDDALNKKQFTSLKLTVTPTGQTVGLYGTVEHDGPPISMFVVPTFKKKK